MSGVAQRRKGPKIRQLTCTNTRCFLTREAAREFINEQRNKGIRGSRTLETFKCLIHSNKQGEIFHVRQRRRDL